MRKTYVSPKIEVFSIEGPVVLLEMSGEVEVTIDGDKTEITDGGTTDPDENYNPW